MSGQQLDEVSLARLVKACEDREWAESERRHAINARETMQRTLHRECGWSQHEVAARTEAELRARGWDDARITAAGVGYPAVRRACDRLPL